MIPSDKNQIGDNKLLLKFLPDDTLLTSSATMAIGMPIDFDTEKDMKFNTITKLIKCKNKNGDWQAIGCGITNSSSYQNFSIFCGYTTKNWSHPYAISLFFNSLNDNSSRINISSSLDAINCLTDVSFTKKDGEINGKTIIIIDGNNKIKNFNFVKEYTKYSLYKFNFHFCKKENSMEHIFQCAIGKTRFEQEDIILDFLPAKDIITNSIGFFCPQKNIFLTDPTVEIYQD